jgi:hypothetical protein
MTHEMNGGRTSAENKIIVMSQVEWFWCVFRM